MKFKLGLMLLLFALLTCSTGLAAENTYPIPGLGTITFPADVEILETRQIDNKFPSKLLLANDNGTWRTLKILFLPIPNITADAVLALKIASAELTKDANLLYSGPITQFVIYNKQFTLKSVKFLSGGMVYRMDFYVVQDANGGIGIGTYYVDGDTNYWGLKIIKMVTSIKLIGEK